MGEEPQVLEAVEGEALFPTLHELSQGEVVMQLGFTGSGFELRDQSSMQNMDAMDALIPYPFRFKIPTSQSLYLTYLTNFLLAFTRRTGIRRLA